MLRGWWSKRPRLSRRQDDLAEEIESNLTLAADEHAAAGMAEPDARFAARRDFGNVALTLEKSREVWTVPPLERLFHDLRSGLRAMARAKLSSALVIVTLALGIGATTAIFSVVQAVLLAPLPFPHADRLILLGETTKQIESFSVSWGNYLAWRERNRGFEAMAAYHTGRLTMTGRGGAVLIRAAMVTGNLFKISGGKPVTGRFFTAAEEHRGAAPVTVLSESFWRGQFAADPNILGKAVDLDGKSYQVVGVVSQRPQFFSGGIDCYLPLAADPNLSADRSSHGSISVLALLRQGFSLPDAIADLNRIMAGLARTDPGPEKDHRASGARLTEEAHGEFRSPLLLLMGAVLLVLLIACANVASLVLARSAGRAKEIAVRAALGAGSKRLARQLLTENLLVSSFGGLLGLLVAQAGLRTLLTIAPHGYQRPEIAHLHLPVLLFALGITLFSGLAVGLVPVLAARQVNLMLALNASGRSSTSDRSRGGARGLLVILEIAVTLVLAFVSGLLLKSLVAAETKKTGFVPDHILAVELVLPGTKYRSDARKDRFFADLIEQAQAIPGVRGASAVCTPAGVGECFDWFYSVPGKPAPSNDQPISLFNIAQPGYFSLLQIPLLAGREFTNSDRAGGAKVAIVNATVAKRWWPNESAIGKQIKQGGETRPGPMVRIVGVVGDFGQMGLDLEPYPEVFLPFAQAASSSMVLLVRDGADSPSTERAVRNVVRALDPNLAIQSSYPLYKTVESTLDRRKFLVFLLTIFASLAMLLAGVGVYGVLNYWVSAREDEIAIRMALGARRMRIVGWVGAEAIRLCALGVLIGGSAAWAGARYIESLLFGISARNAPTLAAGVLLSICGVTIIVLLAAAFPAWRAVCVDPIERLNRA